MHQSKSTVFEGFFCSDLPWVELKILGFFWNHVSSVYKIKESPFFLMIKKVCCQFELLSLSFDKSQYDRQLHSLNSGIRNVMATNTDLHTFLNLKPGRSFTFMDQVNFVDPRWYKFRRFVNLLDLFSFVFVFVYELSWDFQAWAEILTS